MGRVSPSSPLKSSAPVAVDHHVERVPAAVEFEDGFEPLLERGDAGLVCAPLSSSGQGDEGRVVPPELCRVLSKNPAGE
jgi:hypothetical protein